MAAPKIVSGGCGCVTSKLVLVDLRDRAREHQPAAVAALLPDVLEEDRLVREDVRLIVHRVVLREQVVVEEARRSGTRDHERRVQDLDVAEGARELRDALLVGEDLLRTRRELVDHRIPDGARELEEQHVQLAQREQLIGIDGPRVVHVEDPDIAVVDEQVRVADRTVGGRAQRVDHQPQRPGLERDEILRLDEPVEAQPLELLAEGLERVGGQQDLGVLVAMLGQPARIEVIVVEMADVEVRGRADDPRIDAVVGGEGEPRREVRGVEPRIGEDADALRLEEEPGLAEECDPHGDRGYRRGRSEAAGRAVE